MLIMSVDLLVQDLYVVRATNTRMCDTYYALHTSVWLTYFA